MANMGISVFLIGLLLIQLNPKLAIADCIMKNKSNYDIEITPADGSGNPMECKSGSSMVVPANYQNCKLKNKQSNHEMGPFTLPDHKFVVVVNGSTAQTANVYIAAFFRRFLKFIAPVCTGL